MANPGFEAGSATPLNWGFTTKNGNTPVLDSTIAHTGTKSVRISISGTTDTISGEVLSDYITSASGTTYTFAAWGKSQGAAGTNNPAVRVAEYNENKIWLRQTNLHFPKGTVDWNQLQTTFTTGADTAYINVYANIWNGIGTFWVDDISLTKTTSTTTPPAMPTSTATSAPTVAPTSTPTTTPTPTAISPAPITAPTGKTYYVATNGNDGSSGSSSSPWRTIQHAADTVSAGDMVYVMGGTYNEKVTITRSGSSGNYITFAAYPGQTPIIDGTGKVGNWDGLIHITSANWIKVIGFTVKNSVWNGIMIDDFGGSRSSNIIIQNNLVRDIGYSGIYAQNSDYITYDGNTVTNTQTNGFGGPANSQQNENVNLIGVNNFEIKNNHIYATANFESLDVKLGSSTGSIHNNDISPTMSAGIYIDAWAQPSQNIDIYDNYVHDSSNSGSRGIAIGAEQGGSAKYINVYNNIIANLPATGIAIPWYSKGTVDSIKIINNVVYKTDTVDKWVGGIGIQANTNGGTTSNIIVRNNIVSQNGVAQIGNDLGSSSTITNNLIDGSGGVTGSNYITGNPQFVNPAGGDFRIQSSSPAINQGTSTDAPAVDFNGVSRPNGGGYDIGVYEY
jgi:parallel beta-helix repeat protein